METETGKIVSLKNGKAVIEMEADSQCTHCGARHACSAMGGVVRQIEIPIEKGIHIGDQVTLSYQAKSRIISAALDFMLPIVFLIVGYFVGFALFGIEGKAILSGIAALIFSFVVLWGVNKLLARGRAVFAEDIKSWVIFKKSISVHIIKYNLNWIKKRIPN